MPAPFGSPGQGIAGKEELGAPKRGSAAGARGVVGLASDAWSIRCSTGASLDTRSDERTVKPAHDRREGFRRAQGSSDVVLWSKENRKGKANRMEQRNGH